MEYQIPEHPGIKKGTQAPDRRKFAVVPLRSIELPGITLASLKVLIALASYCNKAGSSYVSQDKLAQDLGVTRQAVQQQLKRLESLGLIKQYPNHYPQLKGATRRIVYDESLDDAQVQAVANEPIEMPRHELRERHIKRYINELQTQEQALEVAQSSQEKNDVLTSLFQCVSTEAELLHLERLLNAGMAPESIKAHQIQSGTLPPLPPGL